MRHLKKLAVAWVLTLCLVSIAEAGKISTDANGVALQGYDLVSYFTAHQAVRGSKARCRTRTVL